ncbi:nucleotidyltransferase family protein [Shewanella sp. 10N.286.45.A1]|uniref:nucleotidyltransferase family protein n=1 Tax=Shewanella sp. 10N.286.45.A1 TaxID=3229694 RepID=UPI0035522D11
MDLLATKLSDYSFSESKLKGLIDQHRVWSVVARNINKLDTDYFSAEFYDWLNKANERCKRKTLQQFKVQSQIAAKFDRLGISYRFFKGSDLALRLYGDLVARSSNDIDLLVAETDVIAAEAILLEFGYSAMYGQFSDSCIASKLHNERSKDRSYNAKNLPLIELHLRIGNIETEFTKTVTDTLLKKTNSLSVIEYLYLCYHAMRTSCHRVKWLVDIASYHEALSRQNPDWHLTKWALAKRYGLSKQVSLMERLLETSFALSVTAVPSWKEKAYEQHIIKTWHSVPQNSGGFYSVVVMPFLLEGCYKNQLLILKHYIFGVDHLDKPFINQFAITDGRLARILIPVRKVFRLFKRVKSL